MARPRIFVSSTYYDLKHVRSSLDNFIDALGFDSVLSEKGDIAFSPDVALDESCYRDAAGADIFVLIVGGRYGSASSTEEKKPTGAFFERYESITRKEYDSASEKDIPIYILIEQNVYAEYHTYLKNKENRNIQYAHVDSVNVFQLIQNILSKPRNNPVHTFERFSEIESWLREQWAGLFRELLQRTSGQKQLASLSSQVETLGAINDTLKTYLEAVIAKVSPEEGKELIRSERKRLGEIEQLDALRRNSFFMGVLPSSLFTVSVEVFKDALLNSNSFAQFINQLGKSGKSEAARFASKYEHNERALSDLNEARSILELPPFLKSGSVSEQETSSAADSGQKPSAKRARRSKKVA